jgi:hypothetical protein
MSASRAFLAIGAALCLSACQVVPKTNETSGPKFTVTLADKLHNQGWPNDRKIVHSGGTVTVDPSLDILVTISAKDSGGMDTLDSDVMFHANACGSSGGTFVSTIDTSNQTAHPNPPGTVTDTLFYLHELTTHDLKSQPCDPLHTTSSGLGTVVLLARATNASQRASNFTFNIHTVGGVSPHS